MKRVIAVLMACLMLTGCVIAKSPQETEEAIPVEEVQVQPAETEKEMEQENVPAAVYDHLTVGGLTPFAGAFSTEMWGNDTSDIDIRYLLHGYNLVQWNSGLGAFEVDPTVVSGIVVTQNPAGDRTYTMSLYSDLKYSDGTVITAADYAFSLLLSVAPEIAEIGGNPANLSYLLGYEDYISGKIPYFSGIRIQHTDTIALTVKHEYLPFFYELGLLRCNPYPISVIAPGCVVRDDGNGAYIANLDRTIPEPIFTAQLLEETMLDPVAGYVTHPSVTSGPYTLVSYDGEKVELALNELYKGNTDGEKPTIPYLTAVTVQNSSMLDALENGDVDLLNKVVSAEVLRDGTARIAQLNDFTMSNYMRTGLSFISFCCENPLVSEKEVRQAIASCLDKDGLVEDTVDIYGIRVDGYYGLGQWMYQMIDGSQNYPLEVPAENATAQEKREYEEKLAGWEALSLDGVRKYALDLSEAARLLDRAGWTLNHDGKRYDAGTDDVRCRRNTAGEIEELKLKVLCPEGSSINANLKENLFDHMAEAGILVEVTELPMPELLRYYYRAEDRDCAMIVLASNFNVVFDPSDAFRPDEGDKINRYNVTAANDVKLYEKAVQMRQTEPDDPLGYCRKWVEFQTQFQETVPMIPLYSNVYFDFYNRILHDYDVGSNISWSQAIVGSYLSDVSDEETAAFDTGEIEVIGD